MKKILLYCHLLISINCLGQQRATLNNDTLYYSNHKFHSGDTLQLGYGSSSDKNFAFIYMGTGIGGVSKVESTWAKSFFVVDKIDKRSGKYFLRGKIIEAKLGPMKLFVDVEGAIDNKELFLN